MKLNLESSQLGNSNFIGQLSRNDLFVIQIIVTMGLKLSSGDSMVKPELIYSKMKIKYKNKSCLHLIHNSTFLIINYAMNLSN